MLDCLNDFKHRDLSKFFDSADLSFCPKFLTSINLSLAKTKFPRLELFTQALIFPTQVFESEMDFTMADIDFNDSDDVDRRWSKRVEKFWINPENQAMFKEGMQELSEINQRELISTLYTLRGALIPLEECREIVEAHLSWSRGN